MQSGIRLLAMVVAIVVASVAVGVLTTKTGYYTPFLLLGICIAAVGSGLLTTLTVHTTKGQWIGYQVVYGFGLGACFQAPNMAAQTVLPRKEVSIGASLMLFSQTLFGAIFVSVGQNVLDNQLVKRFARAGIKGITSQQVENAGATGLINTLPSQDRTAALVAYNSSLRVVFRVAVVLACLAIIGGLGMEWRSVKKEKDREGHEGEKASESSKNSGDLSDKEANIAELASQTNPTSEKEVGGQV